MFPGVGINAGRTWESLNVLDKSAHGHFKCPFGMRSQSLTTLTLCVARREPLCYVARQPRQLLGFSLFLIARAFKLLRRTAYHKTTQRKSCSVSRKYSISHVISEAPIAWRGTPAVVHRYAPTGTSPASRASRNARGSPNTYFFPVERINYARIAFSIISRLPALPPRR